MGENPIDGFPGNSGSLPRPSLRPYSLPLPLPFPLAWKNVLGCCQQRDPKLGTQSNFCVY